MTSNAAVSKASPSYIQKAKVKIFTTSFLNILDEQVNVFIENESKKPGGIEVVSMNMSHDINNNHYILLSYKVYEVE